MVWILPVTSQDKTSLFYEKFDFQGVNNYVALSQIRTVSTKRFLRKVGIVKKGELKRIVEKVITFLITNEDPR